MRRGGGVKRKEEIVNFNNTILHFVRTRQLQWFEYLLSMEPWAAAKKALS